VGGTARELSHLPRTQALSQGKQQCEKSSSKNSQKSYGSYCFVTVTSLGFFIFEKLCKRSFKK
jgi:hypothetical protein